jgi:trk system potassium uptake protein TrkA
MATTTIVGAGMVGLSLAERLASGKMNVIVVDLSAEALGQVGDRLDVQTIQGHGADPRIIETLKASGTDLLIAVTDSDEVNMISALTAKQAGIKRTVARIRNEVYLQGTRVLYRDLLGIDLVISPWIVTAMKIANTISTRGSAEVESFANGRIRLLHFPVTNECPLVHRRLSNIPTPGFLITGIRREGEMIVPGGGDELFPGDQVWVVAIAGEENRVLKLFSAPREEAKRVFIVGGGQVGLLLAQTLEKRNISVRILEQDRARCEELSAALSSKTAVLHGSGTDLNLLKEEHAGRMDVFAAVTDEHESNIISALLARRLGAAKTICLSNRSDYVQLIQDLGIDMAFNPRLLTASAIQQFLHRGSLISMEILEDGKAEILEILADLSAKAVGRKLKDLGLPKGSIIGAMNKKDGVIVPGGEDTIEAGDTVVVFTVPENIPEIQRIF